ncbi:hypothetical protein GCM10028828_13960 [Corynebacterium tapiri]
MPNRTKKEHPPCRYRQVGARSQKALVEQACQDSEVGRLGREAVQAAAEELVDEELELIEHRDSRLVIIDLS